MIESTFRLQDHASDFVTRDLGRHLRAKLLAFEASVSAAEQIRIDASEITIMTPSFVDEFFGRTAAHFGIEQFRRRFKIVGIQGDMQHLVNKVVRNRLLLDAKPGAPSP